MHKTTIIDKIFHTKIILTYGTLDEVKRWLNKSKIELDHKNDWQAFSGQLPTGEYHLHFDYYGFTAIVHETNHATLEILNNSGININQETKEIFAYYQDWLAGKCRDYLEKWTNNENETRKIINKTLNGYTEEGLNNILEIMSLISSSSKHSKKIINLIKKEL